MGRKKQDDIKREGYSVPLQPELIKKIRLAAVNKGKPAYIIVEEALTEYFNGEESEK
jgi:hypothetical protein